MKDALGDTFPEVNDTSVRKGCISECVSEVPPEHTTVANGHDLRRESAMLEYLSWTLPAGANVWITLLGGQLVRGVNAPLLPSPPPSRPSFV